MSVILSLSGEGAAARAGGALPPVSLRGCGEVLLRLLPVGLHRLRAGLPVRGADLAVLTDELEGLEQAERLVHGAADAEVVDRRVLDDAVGVDEEEAAQGDLPVLGEDAVFLGELLAEVLEERVREALDAALLAALLGPREVAVFRVDGGAEDLGAELFELAEAVREREDLGRADEREVERVEEEDDPLPPVVREAVVGEAPVEDAVEGEFRGLAADDLGHGVTPWMLRADFSGRERPGTCSLDKVQIKSSPSRLHEPPPGPRFPGEPEKEATWQS